jgi:putative drug exporter of the RND superfamily
LSTSASSTRQTTQSPVRSEITIASIGFSLAFGDFAGAFLIRMTVLPAVHTLLGNRAWHLPRRIDRILPNVDIERKHLQQQFGDRSSVKPTEA